jgi:hypothetical protein
LELDALAAGLHRKKSFVSKDGDHKLVNEMPGGVIPRALMLLILLLLLLRGFGFEQEQEHE